MFQTRRSSGFRDHSPAVQRERVLGHSAERHLSDQHVLQTERELRRERPADQGRRRAHRRNDQGEHADQGEPRRGECGTRPSGATRG